MIFSDSRTIPSEEGEDDKTYNIFVSEACNFDQTISKGDDGKKVIIFSD